MNMTPYHVFMFLIGCIVGATFFLLYTEVSASPIYNQYHTHNDAEVCDNCTYIYLDCDLPEWDITMEVNPNVGKRIKGIVN